MNPIENRQTEIATALENLENFRLDKIAIFNREKASLKAKSNKKGFFIFLTFITSCILSAIFPSFFPYFLLAFLLALSLLLDSTYTPSKTHINAYQQSVKKDLIEAAFPTVQYVGNGYHFKIKITASKLLDDNFAVKDHFQGQTKNGYPFEFAAVESTSESGTVFKGFLFAIESPDISCEEILVFKKPNRSSKINGVSINGIYPEFERFYGILCKNPDEAKKLLTIDFLTPIYELSQKWGAEIRWSFIGNQIYVAIRTGNDLFANANIFHSIHANDWAKNFCEHAIPYIEAVETISLQLEQIPEKIKIDIKDNKIKLLNDNSAYDHLIE